MCEFCGRPCANNFSRSEISKSRFFRSNVGEGRLFKLMNNDTDRRLELLSYKLSYIILLKFVYVGSKCAFSFTFSYHCFVNGSSKISSASLELCRIQLYYVMLCIRNCFLQRESNSVECSKVNALF